MWDPVDDFISSSEEQEQEEDIAEGHFNPHMQSESSDEDNCVDVPPLTTFKCRALSMNRVDSKHLRK